MLSLLHETAKPLFAMSLDQNCSYLPTESKDVRGRQGWYRGFLFSEYTIGDQPRRSGTRGG